MYGGSQQFLYQISKELIKRGHQISIFTSDVKRSNLKERVKKVTEEVEGIKIFHFKHISTLLTTKIKLIITPKMKKFLTQKGHYFDLIHVHEARGYQPIAVWQVSSKNKLKYIVQAHGIIGQRGTLSTKIYDLIYGRRILKYATMNIALNKYETEHYKAMGVSKNRTTIIPNGIDLSEFCTLPQRGSFRKTYAIDDKEKIVLYLGRIHWIKGIDILVKAFANIIGKLDDLKLVIVGQDDGFLLQLKSLVKALRIDHAVMFLGPLYGKSKLEAYVDADVFVLPSRYEAFGLTVLEAYACRKPVVATSCDGLKELILDHETGILVKPEGVFELSEALYYILSKNVNKMGLKAKNFVKQFNIQKTVDKLERLYVNTVSAK
jgi:glycosyltransferase involved in cell wall biosynthesis